MPNYKTEFASLPIQYQGQVGDNDVIFRARNYRRKSAGFNNAQDFFSIMF
jgi:hypothetical protein